MRNVRENTQPYNNEYRASSINNIVIDPKLSGDKRMAKYLSEIENPYCLSYGETIIRLKFSDIKTLDSCLKNYFKSLKYY